MSIPSAANEQPVTSKRQLVENLAGGGKAKRDWRIGTEHEKFVFRLSDRKRLPFDGPDGIRALLTKLERFGWTPIMEGPNPIALKKDGASVSLEPGGQLELSGAPLKSIHQTCEEVNQHLAEVKAVDEELGVGLLGLGFDPQWPRADVPWMPKGRYKIMREYMPKRGKLGLDMMLRTCTVQVNLDFADEADMIKKFRTSLALQPVATALFANSPFTEGKPNGFLSYRSHIWTDTDPDRSGMIPFVFEPGMSFERYVDYMLDVPMYFVYRDGKYIDASGQSFRDFMNGKLPAYPGHQPTMSDWADHLTTAFPEVRLKTYLEMRGADGGPWRRLCALPALWVGLLYDSGALDAAWDLCKDWTIEEMQALRRDVPKYGLKTKFRRGTLQEVAVRMVAIARQGLAARAMADKCGMDETGFLNTLQDIADRGQTPAEELLDAYRTRWNGNIDKVYEEYAY
ncbi:MAG: glutamate--cysteine ligase [Alphaproteobacteria bacterium]